MFENGGRESVVGVVVSLVAAGDVRMPMLELYELTKLKIVHARMAVAAGNGQGALSLDVNLMMKRASEICAEGMRTRVVVEDTGRHRGHWLAPHEHDSRVSNAARTYLLNATLKGNSPAEKLEPPA